MQTALLAAAVLSTLAEAIPQIAATAPPAGTAGRQFKLNDIPKIGMGTVGFMTASQTKAAFNNALKLGFRAFDTADIYRNEEVVGTALREGLKANNLTREDIWVTTKLWNTNHGSKAPEGLAGSLKKLNLDYIDLYLVHFPIDSRGEVSKADPVDTWKEMEKLITPGGPVRFIGVSNHSPKMLDDVLKAATIKPKYHQIEAHPYLPQTEYIKSNQAKNITVIGYAPLANTSPAYTMSALFNANRPGAILSNDVITAVAKERSCTPAQVVLGWNVRRGVAVIPKAGNTKHQQENITADKCKLTDSDVAKIDGISAKWSQRSNNMCKSIDHACFEGLALPKQGLLS